VVGIQAKLADFFRRFEHWLENDFERDAAGCIKGVDDARRVLCDLVECFGTVKVLTAGDEPNFDGTKFHRNGEGS
jgi:hypothetical protein